MCHTGAGSEEHCARLPYVRRPMCHTGADRAPCQWNANERSNSLLYKLPTQRSNCGQLSLRWLTQSPFYYRAVFQSWKLCQGMEAGGRVGGRGGMFYAQSTIAVISGRNIFCFHIVIVKKSEHAKTSIWDLTMSKTGWTTNIQCLLNIRDVLQRPVPSLLSVVIMTGVGQNIAMHASLGRTGKVSAAFSVFALPVHSTLFFPSPLERKWCPWKVSQTYTSLCRPMTIVSFW